MPLCDRQINAIKLGAGKSVSRSMTTYENVAIHSTMYRTILDDTRASIHRT